MSARCSPLSQPSRLPNAFPVLFFTSSREGSRRLKDIFSEAAHLIAGGHDWRHETASSFGKGTSDIALDPFANAADDTANHLHTRGETAHDDGGTLPTDPWDYSCCLEPTHSLARRFVCQRVLKSGKDTLNGDRGQKLPKQQLNLAVGEPNSSSESWRSARGSS